MFFNVIKKVVKWSTVGGLIGAAYGLGRMNPPRSAGYIRYRNYRKGRK